MVNRTYSREKPYTLDIKTREKVKLGFVGAASGAGATTLAHGFARFLSANTELLPSVVELSDKRSHAAGCPYDKIGIDRRFAGREYTSYYKQLRNNNPLRHIKNIDGGINWCLRIPGADDEDLSRVEMVRLINSVPASIALCDLSLDIGSDDMELLTGFDQLVFVVDPLPSRLLAAFSRLEATKMLEVSGYPIIYLVNKYEKGINKRELENYLNVKSYLKVPYIDAKNIYELEFACKSIYDSRQTAQELSKAFTALYEQVNQVCQNLI